MRRAGLEAKVVHPPPEAEKPPSGLSPAETALAAARAKALAVVPGEPDALVLGADTVVAADGEALGKPGSRDEARAMLSRLAARAHEVYTAVVIAACVAGRPEFLAEEVVSSRVIFRALTLREIEDYLDTGEPMDKAGGYGIQGRGGALVKAIEGPWDNVVGLPVVRTLELLVIASQALARKEGNGETALV